MKIRITKGGIFGTDGEIQPGTELDIASVPTAWGDRYVVISGSGEGKTPVINPAEPDLDGMTVVELKAYAAEKGIDLQGATLKADIVAAIQLAA